MLNKRIIDKTTSPEVTIVSRHARDDWNMVSNHRCNFYFLDLPKPYPFNHNNASRTTHTCSYILKMQTMLSSLSWPSCDHQGHPANTEDNRVYSVRWSVQNVADRNVWHDSPIHMTDTHTVPVPILQNRCSIWMFYRKDVWIWCVNLNGL